MADADEDYFLPLQDQRVFGAGIKRKRIAFIPASTSDPAINTTDSKTSCSVGSRYLAIVLPKSAADVDAQNHQSHCPQQEPSNRTGETCTVCDQSLSSADSTTSLTSHESSIAHQVCLQHSHPPSHLSREHVGLKYLSNYGWDPDSGKGLGPRQEGIRIPIKAKEKKDTVGLREVDDDEQIQKKKTLKVMREEKVTKLNAKEVRLREMDAKKRAEKLRQSLYGPDLERYLGPNS